MDEVVNHFVLPFEDVARNGRLLMQCSGDGPGGKEVEMSTAGKAAQEEGERACAKLKTVFGALLNSLPGTQLAELVEGITADNCIKSLEHDLQHLLFDIDKYLQPETFKPSQFENLCRSSRNYALALYASIKRQQLRLILQKSSDSKQSLSATGSSSLLQPVQPTSEMNLALSTRSTNTFHYTPLASDQRTIRILWVDPITQDNLDADIIVQLEEVFLDSCRGYHAISYTWDGQKPSVPIRCNGQTLLVTRNCFSILKRQRTLEPVALWIDAVCINQTSTDERNHQVALMGDIYRLAERVIVWVGDFSIQEEKLLQPLALATLHQQHRDTFGQLDQEYRKSKASNGFEALQHGFVDHLFSRPYFRRMWTMQEVILPADFDHVYICVGFGEAQFKRLIWGAVLCEQPFDKKCATDIGMLEFFRESLFKMADQPLDQRAKIFEDYDIFSEVRRRECSDPKDKVFALHGIIRMLDPEFPLPDYERDVVDVYTDAAEWLLVKMKHLKMLYYTFSIPYLRARSQLGLSTHRLPSWVPDFTVPLHATESTRMSKSHILRYSATRGSNPLSSVSSDRRLLRLHGKVICSVRCSCRPMTEFKRIFQYDNNSSYFTPAYIVMREWFGAFGSDATRIREAFDGIYQGFAGPDQSPGHRDTWIDAMIASAAHAFRSYIPSDAAEDSDALDYTVSGTPKFLTNIRHEEDDAVRSSWISYCRVLQGWYAFVTIEGLIGFAEGDIKAGHSVAIFSGLDHPLLLCRGRNGCWKLVGRAYLSGVMDGEAWPNDTSDIDEIVLE